MLQRIQSVFLLLCAAAYGSLMALPFASSDIPNDGMMSDRIFNIQDHLVLLVLAIAGAVIALVNIFLYGNRKRQILVNYLLVIIAILIVGMAALFWTQQGDTWMEQAVVRGQPGAFVPVAAIILAFLANHFIKRDEKTIRSSYDRLR